MKIDQNKLGKKPAAGAADFLSAMFSPGAGVQQMEIPIDQLTPWRDAEHSRQPFRPYPPEKLAELSENIAQHGVLTPVFLRPYEGKYQILAGHNRVAAAAMAGLTTIPAIIRDLDDDTAKLVMTDSNLYQREKLLPSEKAWAYRIRLDALKHQGIKGNLTSRQLGEKCYSVDTLSDKSNDSARTIQRFIRLTYLIEPFLDLVDADKIKFTVGVALSHLTTDDQALLLKLMEAHRISKISLSQAEELKAFANELDEPLMLRILGLAAKEPAQRMVSVKIPSTALPPGTPKSIFADEEFQSRFYALVQEFMTRRDESLK